MPRAVAKSARATSSAKPRAKPGANAGAQRLPTPAPAAAQSAVRVAIAGGGIAGLSAALRLAQRGYAVTLYEDKPWLGGNLSSYLDPKSQTYHDVFPHMFSNFYVNFWDIAENELGLRRDASPQSDFASRDGIKTLTLAGGYHDLRAASANPIGFWRDMFSGAGGLSPLNLYLYTYSLLDLIAHRFEQRGALALSLNDYIRSRPCATEPVAALHDTLVAFIWSIHSNATSASSYQNFYRHATGNTAPLMWLLKGSLQQKLIDPLEAKLLALGCTIHKQTRVQQVLRDGRRVVGMTLRSTTYDDATQRVVVSPDDVPAAPFDQLLLAVSPGALGRIADTGNAEQRLNSVMPLLSHAGKRLPSEPIAVLDLYFSKKLVGIPSDNVSVYDSDCDLAYIDMAQLWPQLRDEHITALTVSASDYWALPTDDNDTNAHHLILELAKYVTGFNPGRYWGDPQADIDWQRSIYRSNTDDVIFTNQVGSWTYRPEPRSEAVDNLYFAGDFCRNHIDMATVEAAVSSGVNAAAALQSRQPLGEPIVTLHPPVWSAGKIAALKLLMAPSAYAAKAWLTAGELLGLGGDAGAVPRSQQRVDAAVTLLRLPSLYVGDMVETLGSAWAGNQAGNRAGDAE